MITVHYSLFIVIVVYRMLQVVDVLQQFYFVRHLVLAGQVLGVYLAQQVVHRYRAVFHPGGGAFADGERAVFCFLIRIRKEQAAAPFYATKTLIRNNMIDKILKFNQEFVANKDYEKYITTKYPDKKIAILSCMDTRLTELLPAALGIKNGDVKMIKNAGGIISHPFGSVIRSLLVAIYELGVTEVMVIAHSDCGNHIPTVAGSHAAMDDIHDAHRHIDMGVEIVDRVCV